LKFRSRIKRYIRFIRETTSFLRHPFIQTILRSTVQLYNHHTLVHATYDVAVASDRMLKRGEIADPETGSSRRVYYYTYNIFEILPPAIRSMENTVPIYIRTRGKHFLVFMILRSGQWIQCDKNCLMYVVKNRKIFHNWLFFFQIWNIHLFPVSKILFIVDFPDNLDIWRFTNF